MTKPVRVTDHAVLRWLERECDIDVEAVRAAIGGCCTRGCDVGAKVILVGKVKFIVVDDVIVTTLFNKGKKR